MPARTDLMRGPHGKRGDGVAPDRAPAAWGALAERHFRYVALSPAVLLLLLIGAFPVGYNLVLSLQNQTMFSTDTSFAGLDPASGIHRPPLIIAAVALPLQPCGPGDGPARGGPAAAGFHGVAPSPVASRSSSRVSWRLF
jgi:hypothetical protein